MVKNTCFPTSVEGHILSPDIRPGNDEPYKVIQFGYDQTKLMVTMYSKHTVHISLNGSHFLTALCLVGVMNI